MNGYCTLCGMYGDHAGTCPNRPSVGVTASTKQFWLAEKVIMETHEIHPAGTRERIAALEYALQMLIDHTGWYARFDETLAEDRIRGHRAMAHEQEGQS